MTHLSGECMIRETNKCLLKTDSTERKGVCLLQNRMLFYRLQRFHRQWSAKIASVSS